MSEKNKSLLKMALSLIGCLILFLLGSRVTTILGIVLIIPIIINFVKYLKSNN